MGEKGNVFDNAQDLFANLAEQAPQFWLDYKRFKQEQKPSIVEAGAKAEEEAGEGAPVPLADPPAPAADPPAPAAEQPVPLDAG